MAARLLAGRDWRHFAGHASPIAAGLAGPNVRTLGSVEPSRPTCGSSRRRTRTWANWCAKACFARTSSTAFTSCASRCPTFADRREDIPLLDRTLRRQVQPPAREGRGWRIRRSACTTDGVRLSGQCPRTGEHHRARVCPLPWRAHRSLPTSRRTARHVPRRAFPALPA